MFFINDGDDDDDDDDDGDDGDSGDGDGSDGGDGGDGDGGDGVGDDGRYFVFSLVTFPEYVNFSFERNSISSFVRYRWNEVL